jgi:DNA-binding CsgD family transcriptional regulator
MKAHLLLASRIDEPERDARLATRRPAHAEPEGPGAAAHGVAGGAAPRPAPSHTTSEHQLLLRTLDALDEGMAFFDLDATPIHANRAYQEALAGHPAADPLRSALDAFVDAGCSMSRARHRSSTAARDAVEQLTAQSVTGPAGRCQLRATYVGFDLFGSGPTMLVTLQRSAAPPPPSDETLQERFGLSRTESRVARLIAAGRPNRQIADALEISPHTARNHTSRVLAKLGVRSRAEIGPRLRDESTDGAA